MKTLNINRMIHYFFKTISALLLSAMAFAQTSHQPFTNIKNNKSESPGKAVNLTGRWKGTFHGKDEKAVGLFKQDGNQLKATFLRITGDSRYLDGIVTGNHIYLSTFIGSGPGYYTGTIDKDGSITGAVVNARSSQPFTGIHNEE